MLISEWVLQAVVSLSTQYRMTEDIQLLANTLMYSSALRPGNAAIASAMLHLPHHPLPGLPSWLSQVSQRPPPPPGGGTGPCIRFSAI